MKNDSHTRVKIPGLFGVYVRVYVYISANLSRAFVYSVMRRWIFAFIASPAGLPLSLSPCVSQHSFSTR